MAPLRLAEVRLRMAAAAERSGRSADAVTLVAVSKGQPGAAIAAAYDLGQRDFGESRAQELATKAQELPRDISWHFIGPLQRNKVRIVRPTAVLLHSMDRMRLAGAWLKGPGIAPPVLLQVNIGREQQKAGVDPDEAAHELSAMLAMGLNVLGVMAIPPYDEDPEAARPFFRDLVVMRDQLASESVPLAVVSMGMTEDYEVAIEEGSTMIRVGRAIFGERMTHG